MVRRRVRKRLLTPWFWGLIESSQRNLVSLCRQLEQLPKDKLRRYRILYDNAKFRVSPHYWDACRLHLPASDCSEDFSDDFAAWVVSQGRQFFERVRAHPRDIGRYLEMFSDADCGRGYPELQWSREVDRDEYRGYQRADYIASPVYRLRFAEDLHDACYDERGWVREGV